jgi:16S rRNA (adenine(1408)-N(1))-methyltransferase
VLRRARSEPERLFVGVDADLAGLAHASTRAARKPERGGCPNALFVLAAAESLPSELASLAGEVTVWFPWGSLLRAVARPEVQVLEAIRAIASTGAALDVVFSYDASRDAAEAARLGLPSAPDPAALAAAYEAAGFRLRRITPIGKPDLLAVPSTWAQRHAHGRPRPVWRLVARAI